MLSFSLEISLLKAIGTNMCIYIHQLKKKKLCVTSKVRVEARSDSFITDLKPILLLQLLEVHDTDMEV